MSTAAPPTTSNPLRTQARHAAQAISRCEGHRSPDGTQFTLCVDLDGDSVTATLSDGRIIHAVPRATPGHFIFRDGVEMDARYTIVEEDPVGSPMNRRSVPHFHMTSLDYLILELSNQLVRPHS